MVSPADIDPRLQAALRAHRSTWSREHHKPSYIMFGNKSLDALAALAPTTEAEFLAVYGMGPKKWESFGSGILEVIRATAEATP